MDKSATITILIALIAAAVSVVGWFVGSYLKAKADDRNRRTQESIKFLERQIEEFYGPLFNIVTQIRICSDVLEKLESKAIAVKRPSDDLFQIRHFFHLNYFTELHNEFNRIIRSKLHLIEGVRLPESYYLYSTHTVQEHAQLTMWDEMKLDTSYLKGEPYPDEVFEDLERVLDSIMRKYTDQIRELSHKKKKRKRTHKTENAAHHNLEHKPTLKTRQHPQHKSK